MAARSAADDAPSPGRGVELRAGLVRRMAAGQSSLDDLREAMTALAAVDLVLEMADISTVLKMIDARVHGGLQDRRHQLLQADRLNEVSAPGDNNGPAHPDGSSLPARGVNPGVSLRIKGVPPLDEDIFRAETFRISTVESAPSTTFPFLITRQLHGGGPEWELAMPLQMRPTVCPAFGSTAVWSNSSVT